MTSMVMTSQRDDVARDPPVGRISAVPDKVEKATTREAEVPLADVPAGGVATLRRRTMGGQVSEWMAAPGISVAVEVGRMVVAGMLVSLDRVPDGAGMEAAKVGRIATAMLGSVGNGRAGVSTVNARTVRRTSAVTTKCEVDVMEERMAGPESVGIAMIAGAAAIATTGIVADGIVTGGV